MSIKLMTEVWSDSPYEGSKLLLHLALADFAHDDGYCWPSIATLAHKIRKSERHTTRLLSEMEKEGTIERHLRPYTSNLYRVKCKEELSNGTTAVAPSDATGGIDSLTPMTDDPLSLIRQRSDTEKSTTFREPAEIEYVDLDDLEGTARPKWQIPEYPLETELLAACNAKWFKSGQKTKVRAIIRAVASGNLLGDDVYTRCHGELEDIPDLTQRNIPPLPYSWLEWRMEQARSNHWSVQGLINSLLDRDALVKHCRYKMKALGKTPGKMVNGVYIIAQMSEQGPK